MTIDELRKRKRELVQKKQELECMPQSGENDLLLEILSEELLDVNAQIRTLSSHKCHTPRRVDAHSVTVDRQQFINWWSEDQSFDDEIEQAHDLLRNETIRALERLPPRQREALELRLAGKTRGQIAPVLNIANESVTSLITRAKKSVRRETEDALARRRLLDKGPVLDLADAHVMEAVLLALSPAQAAYFYLYYSEGLSCPQIVKQIGYHHDTIMNEVYLGLRKLDMLLDGQDVLLLHPEALDEPGYKAYCALNTCPKLAQADISLPRMYCRRGRSDASPPRHIPHKWTLHVQISKRKMPPGTPPGKLRTALMGSGEDMLQELKTVFSVCRLQLERKEGRL